MVAWNDVLALPQFWETYYRDHIAIDGAPGIDDAPGIDADDDADFDDGDAAADAVLLHLFQAPAPSTDDAFDRLDLYGFQSTAIHSRLRMLARHDGDIERAVEVAASPVATREDRVQLAARFVDALAKKDTLEPPHAIDLTFADGTIWRIRFTPGPSEMHLLVEDGDELVVGWTGAHFASPILRIEEIEEMCRTLATSGRVPFDPVWLPMLLHPAGFVTATDDVERHRVWIDDAWQRVELAGKPLDDARRAELVERTTRPSVEFRWRRDSKLGWVNDFPHSHRNPTGGWPSSELGERFLAEGFDRVDRFAVRCLDLPPAALRSV
jgi:hypothetical protein